MEYENLSFESSLAKVTSSHTSLLVEILANQQTLITFLLPGIANKNDLTVEEVRKNFDEMVWESKKAIFEKLYTDYGPDLKDLLKDK